MRGSACNCSTLDSCLAAFSYKKPKFTPDDVVARAESKLGERGAPPPPPGRHRDRGCGGGEGDSSARARTPEH